MIRECLARLRYFVFRKKRSELDREMRIHLAQSIAQKKRLGCPQGEARRQALVELGGIERTRNNADNTSLDDQW
jgi:hypothetical protein